MDEKKVIKSEVDMNHISSVLFQWYPPKSRTWYARPKRELEPNTNLSPPIMAPCPFWAPVHHYHSPWPIQLRFHNFQRILHINIVMYGCNNIRNVNIVLLQCHSNRNRRLNKHVINSSTIRWAWPPMCGRQVPNEKGLRRRAVLSSL